MLAELPFVVLIAGAALLGLWWANTMYDTGKISHHLSRKISHMAGGVAFILCPFLFSSFIWPLVLAFGFTILLLCSHLYRPTMFRGTGGVGRSQAFAEVHYPAVAIPLIAIGWGYLGQPWLAIVPLLYLAFGDAITGILRNAIYKREVKGTIGSLGMLLTCVVLAYFVKPYYIGLIGAIVATIAEKYTPTRHFLDDNLTVPSLAFLVMVGLWLHL